MLKIKYLIHLKYLFITIYQDNLIYILNQLSHLIYNYDMVILKIYQKTFQ
jgi:hypothetical protein